MADPTSALSSNLHLSLAMTQDFVIQSGAVTGVINQIEERYALARRRNEEILRDIEKLTAESDNLDGLNDLLQSQNDTLDQQIKLYQETVLPQLQNELKQKQEKYQTKKKEYGNLIAHYEKIWEDYKVVYERLPLAAERTAIQKKVELLKIEAMKTKQKMIEKEKQAEQLQKIKAQRLEVLRREFQESYARNQQAKLEVESLEREVKERKERIALKEEKKRQEQQQIEQEQRERDLERQQQQQQQQVSESTNLSNTSSSNKFAFNIPSLPTLNLPQMPAFNCFKLFSPSSKGAPQSVAQEPYKSPVTAKLERRIQSQPTKPISSTTTYPHPQSQSVPSHGVFRSTNSDVSNPVDADKIDGSQGLNSLTHQMNVQGSCVKMHSQSVGEVSQNTCSNKKELLISTDNFVTKMKETMNSNSEILQDKRMEISSAFVGTVSVGQEGQNGSHFVKEADICQNQGLSACQEKVLPSSLPLLSQQVTEIESHEPGPSRLSPDLFANTGIESTSGSLDDPPFNFDAEYGDELQSPPAFEAVLSPAPGGYNLSPSGSMDDNNGDNGKDIEDDCNQTPSFSAFNFFSTKATNIFGGNLKSDEAESKKNNSSGFSFKF